MFGNSFAALDGGQAEGEEVDVDWVSLKKPQHDVHVRVGPPLEMESTPAQSCLLAVDNEAGIVAVGSINEIRIHKLNSLATALESGSRDATPVSEPLHVISVPAMPLFVRITQSKLVVSFGPSVVVWDVSGKMLHEFSAAAEVDLLPNPSNSQIAAISSSIVTILDVDTFQVVSAFNGSFTSACWSVKGKQLVVGSGDLVQYTPAGEEKARVPRPSLDAAYIPTSILWLENDVFIATYTADDISEVYVIERSKGQHSYTHFIDPLPPSGVYGRNGSPRHAVHVKKWGSLRHLVVLSSPPSADVAVMGAIDGGWKVLNLEETSRASIPAVPDTYEETSCVGLQLDLRSKTPIKQPMEGGVEQPDLAPAPRVLAYTSEGIIAAYNIVIPSAEQYEGMVGATAAPAPAPVASPFTPADKPAFGAQSAFGSPSAFGQSAFELSSPSAFGTPSAFGGKDKTESSFSGFGRPAVSPATSTASPSAFGKSAFGSSSFASPAPAFGASAFGSSSTPSAFGAPSTPAASTAAFGASAFGASPSSGFSGFGKKEASPGTGGFAGFGSKPAAPSPSSGFGAFAKKDTPNPFGASAFGSFGSPATSGANPFAPKGKSPSASPPQSSMGLGGFADALGSSKSALENSPPSSPVPGERAVPGLEDDTPPSSPRAPKASAPTPAPSSSFIKPATAFGGPPSGPFSSPKSSFGSGSGHGAFASTPRPSAPASAPSTTPKDKPTAFGQPAFGASSTPAFGKSSAFGTSTFGAPVQAASPVASTGGFAGFSAAPKTGGFAGFGAPSGGFAAAAKSGESAFGSMLGKADSSPAPQPKSLFSGSAFAPAKVKEEPKEVKATTEVGERVEAARVVEEPVSTGETQPVVEAPGEEATTPPGTPKVALEAEKEIGGYEEDEEDIPESQEDDDYVPSNASSVQVVEAEDADARSADEPAVDPAAEPASTTPSTSPQEASKELAPTEEHTTESLKSVPSEEGDAEAEASAAEEDEEDEEDDEEVADQEDAQQDVYDDVQSEDGQEENARDGEDDLSASETGESESEAPEDPPKRAKSPPPFGFGKANKLVEPQPETPKAETPKVFNKPLFGKGFPSTAPSRSSPLASMPAWQAESNTPPDSPEKSPASEEESKPVQAPKPFSFAAKETAAPEAKSPFSFAPKASGLGLGRPSSAPPAEPERPSIPNASSFAGFGTGKAPGSLEAQEPKSFTGFGAPAAAAEPAKPSFTGFGAPAKATESPKPAFAGFGKPPSTEAKPAFTGFAAPSPTEIKPAFTGFGKPQEAAKSSTEAKLSFGSAKLEEKSEPVKAVFNGFGKPQESKTSEPNMPVPSSEPAGDETASTSFGKFEDIGKPFSTSAPAEPSPEPVEVTPAPAELPKAAQTAPVREEAPFKPQPIANDKGLAGAFLQAYQLMENDIASLSHTLKLRARYHSAVKDNAKPVDRNALGSFVSFSSLADVNTIVDGLVADASAAAEQTEEPRTKMAEVQSLLFKTEAKAAQASKLHKAKTDPSYAKMMRVRQLGPEHTYNQLRLRKETAAVQSRIEQLEAQIVALTRKAEQQHAPLRPPTLDTVNRTVRNIDTTLRQKQSEVDALTSKIKHLTVRKSAPATPKSSTPVKSRLMTPTKVSLRAVENEATMKSLGASMRAEKRQALLTKVAPKPTFQPAFLAGPVPLGSARVTAPAREMPPVREQGVPSTPSAFAGITLGPMDPGSFLSSGRRNTREPSKRSPAAHLSHPATSTTKPATPFFFAPK